MAVQLLLILNAACHNDTNQERLLELQELPLALDYLQSPVPDVARAAVVLLSTASTHATARQQLCALLAANAPACTGLCTAFNLLASGSGNIKVGTHTKGSAN
jgi:hypothetical protein